MIETLTPIIQFVIAISRTATCKRFRPCAHGSGRMHMIPPDGVCYAAGIILSGPPTITFYRQAALESVRVRFGYCRMTFSFPEHHALVTGGASGIGRAVALAFAAAGCRVTATGLTDAEMTDGRASFGE